jgi:hypothetical protein
MNHIYFLATSVTTASLFFLINYKRSFIEIKDPRNDLFKFKNSGYTRFKGNLIYLDWKNKDNSNRHLETPLSLVSPIERYCVVSSMFLSESKLLELCKTTIEKLETITVYSFSNGLWNPRQITAKTLDSIVLRDQLTEDIILDVQEFLNGQDIYKKLGINYHRGYLFHGVPGTGKSSMVNLLASYFKKPVYNVDSIEALKFVPNNCIVLFEDFDAANFDKTILGTFDGFFSQHGNITILTTNDYKSIPANFKRPGRIDKVCYFGYATVDTCVKLFLKFFPGEKELAHVVAKLFGLDDYKIKRYEEEYDKDSNTTRKSPMITPAHLEGFFMRFINTEEPLLEHQLRNAIPKIKIHSGPMI